MPSEQELSKTWQEIRSLRMDFKFLSRIHQIARFNNEVGGEADTVFRYLLEKWEFESKVKSLSDSVRKNLVSYPEQADTFAEMLVSLNKLKF